MLSLAGTDVMAKLRNVSAGSAAHAALAPLLLWFRDTFRCMRPVVDIEMEPEESGCGWATMNTGAVKAQHEREREQDMIVA